MIYFIRHAESKYNKVEAQIKDKLGQNYMKSEEYLNAKFNPDYFDVEITEKGYEQCLNARKDVQSLEFDVILVSPLRRALRTCSLMLQDHKSKAPVIVEPAFRQIMESSNDVGTKLIESQKQFSTFNFSSITDKQAWYVHTLHQKADREAILSKIDQLKGEDRSKKAVELTIELMKENWSDRDKNPNEEQKLKERILPSHSQQVKVIKQYLKKYNKIGIVAHSECIKRYAGYKINNCQVFPYEASKI